jgi:asparagine synthase (glutamine-hydrolysing)
MQDPLNRELYVDIKTYLVDDILAKVDRASMAVGLEVRVPLLDHKLVEFMARIPAGFKLRNGAGKYVFKQAFRPVLGTEIVDRSKMGFAIPLQEWLLGPLRDTVEEMLFSPQSHVHQWLDTATLRRHWSAMQRGLAYRQSLLWATLMLEAWAGTHLSSGRESPSSDRLHTTARARGNGHIAPEPQTIEARQGDPG